MGKNEVVIGADMGESFGRYRLGNDEEVMKYVTAANVACGFHAGDPIVMRNTVKLAKKYNVSVGAHPGFQDLRGFGRRMIEVTTEELFNDLIYQLGALDAFLKVEGLKMTHVSPHGKLDPLVSYEEEYTETYLEAIKEYNPELIIIAEEKSILYKKAKAFGFEVATVAYPDLKYDSKGDIVIERVKKAVNPIEVAQRAISIVKYHKIKTIEGNEIKIHGDMLCFHGDSPNAIEVLEVVRKEFEKEGIVVKRFHEGR